MSGQTPLTPTNPIQQVTEMLDMSSLVQQRTGGDPTREADNIAAKTMCMPLEQLQRDPKLWAAYARGWDDRTADIYRNLQVTNPSLTYPPTFCIPAPHQRPTAQPITTLLTQMQPPVKTLTPPLNLAGLSQPLSHANKQTGKEKPEGWLKKIGLTTSTHIAAPQTTPPPIKQMTKRQQKNKERMKKFVASKKAESIQQRRLNAKRSPQNPNQDTGPLTTHDNTIVTDGPAIGGSATIEATSEPVHLTITDTTPEEMEKVEEENQDLDTTWRSITMKESSPTHDE